MEELLKWVPLAQVVATTMLGIGTFFVAIVAAYINYRNNFGWAPRLLTFESGLGAAVSHPKHRSFSFEVQVWNRRKYPISLLHCTMTLSDLRMDTEMGVEMTPRMRDGHYVHVSDELQFDMDNILQPNTSVTTHIKFYYRSDPPMDPHGFATFAFLYYDPKAHKRGTIRDKKRFTLSTKIRFKLSDYPQAPAA